MEVRVQWWSLEHFFTLYLRQTKVQNTASVSPSLPTQSRTRPQLKSWRQKQNSWGSRGVYSWPGCVFQLQLWRSSVWTSSGKISPALSDPVWVGLQLPCTQSIIPSSSKSVSLQVFVKSPVGYLLCWRCRISQDDFDYLFIYSTPLVW